MPVTPVDVHGLQRRSASVDYSQIHQGQSEDALNESSNQLQNLRGQQPAFDQSKSPTTSEKEKDSKVARLGGKSNIHSSPNPGVEVDKLDSKEKKNSEK